MPSLSFFDEPWLESMVIDNDTMENSEVTQRRQEQQTDVGYSWVKGMKKRSNNQKEEAL
jgi:hypothetical protein